MRVRLAASFYHPYIGGIESHVRTLAQSLRAHDVDLDVVCLTNAPGEPASVEDVDGIRVHRLRWRAILGGLVRCDRFPPGRYDLVHFHGFSRPLLMHVLGGKARSAPLIITPHGGLLNSKTDSLGTRLAIKNAFDATVTTRILREARSIIAVSDAEAHDLRRRFHVSGDRIAVWGNPLPQEAFTAAKVSPGGSGRFVAIGRLAKVKRLTDLVAAIGADPALPGCDIYGPDADGASELRAAIAALPPGRIRLFGPVAGSEKMNAIRAARAVVLCSEREGNSVAALEAIAQGTPVVASSGAVDGLPPAACLTFPTGDIAALVRALRRVEEEREERLLAVDRARSALTDAGTYAARVLELYRGVCR